MKKRFSNRLSFTCTCLRDYETIKSFEALFDEGFGGIEIFYPYDMPIDKINDYTRAIHEITDGRNLTMIMHLPFGKTSDIAKDTDSEYAKTVYNRYLDAIDYGKKFNVDRFTLHLGMRTTGNFDKLIERVQGLCDKAYPANIMIENMPILSEYAATEEELIDIFKKVNKPNLKLIYDTGHGHVVMKDYNLERKLLDDFKDTLYHFHINDNDTSGDQHRKIGAGNINFKEVFKNLKVNNYSELFSLEILYNDVNDLREYGDTLTGILRELEID